MIKRRFYRAEHAEKDGASDNDSSSSSSSSDDSDIEPPPTSVVNHDVDSDASDGVNDVKRPHYPSLSSSGYESKDSSGNELDADRSGLIGINDNDESEDDKGGLDSTPYPKKENSLTAKTKPEVLPVAEKVSNFVLKSKSVFKCKLCPKIICLNEESLNTHLKSKKHARSEKLLNDGRLKRFLNSDGEEEVVSDDEDGETHAERHARIISLAKEELATKKNKGRQRQKERLKKKKQKTSEKPSLGDQKDNRAKRRKKNVG